MKYISMLFGEQITLEQGNDGLSFIADDCLVAENDVECELGDFGVRKYDNGSGRLLSSIIIFEEYRLHSNN